MGTQNNNGKPLVSGSKDALDRMRNEIANELAINVPNDDYWGNVSSRDCGRVGGRIGGPMVRKMIQMAEEQLKNR